MCQPLEFAHRRSNADVSANSQPKRGRVEPHRKSDDDAQIFQALHPVGRALRRQADHPGEIGDRRARIPLERLDQAPVGFIERDALDSAVIWHLWLRNLDQTILSPENRSRNLQLGWHYRSMSELVRPSQINLADRVPPHAFFMVSALFHYLGPSFAILLFSHVGVLGVAWLRIASAAAVFAVWRRPWRVVFDGDRGARKLIVALGITLALMNSAF